MCIFAILAIAKNFTDTDAEEAPTEPEAALIERNLETLSQRLRQAPLTFDLIGDDDEEQPEDDDIIPALAYIIDLTDDVPSLQTPPPTPSIRNPSIPQTDSVERFNFNGAVLEPGLTVEIRALEQPHLFKTSFLHIKQIFNTPDGITVRGIPLTRTRNLRGRLPRLCNEVAMVLHVDEDDSRPEEDQAAIEVPVTDVIKIRNCHMTNADYPQHRTVHRIYASVDDAEQQGVLMCRWRCIFKYKDSATRVAHIKQERPNAAPFEYIVEHLSSSHVTKKRFLVSETSRFNNWRGGKVRGGDYDPKKRSGSGTGPIISVDGDDDDDADSELVMVEKQLGQRYTFGDMFCGAGGASYAARKGGFQVTISCDHDRAGCSTYAIVFPETQLHVSDIFDYILSTDSKRCRVDVLHLSPPCQFWSPAHTCAGVNDDANIAVLFSCRELIKLHRPRLFTLEQTFGILHPKFEFYFNSLIHGFTMNHYSVRWKIVDLVDWGSPARRRRLIMIGACPGEDLPPFPVPTHAPTASKKENKKAYLTVKKMLDRIPRNASDYDEMHQPQDMVRKRLPRWDPDVTLSRCITTNGGYGNYHPIGRRDFTLREYATLQTFPLNYPFQSSCRKRQIGNAFPPMVAKVLFLHLRKWLENKDCVFSGDNEPFDPDDPDIDILDLESEGLNESSDDDVEFLSSQPAPQSEESSDEDDMDIDMDDDNYNFGICADMSQAKTVWDPIDLTEGDEADNTQAPVDPLVIEV
ncbi:S-adenosyl-L-methionine-dependent methyltransferase [Nemania sp. FL0916]|nr:S-adenosyl-L-methionine-dependent methyltransferase [Nemania sp. FL0916]